MCTSFTIYSNEILYGMNFDISSRPIKFSLVIRNSNKALLILQKENGTFYPAFGFTESGVFANLLMVKQNEKGKYRRGKNVVHIMKIFDEVMTNQISVEDIKGKYNNHSIVNVPNFSVHSMISNMNTTIFLEPGEGIVYDNEGLNKYFVLSNSSIVDFEKAKDSRYNICRLGLDEQGNNISVEKGFDILKSCSQSDGDYPTQLSIISKPREKEIYLAVERNYEKIYKYSFETDKISIYQGCEKADEILLKKELLLTELV